MEERNHMAEARQQQQQQVMEERAKMEKLEMELAECKHQQLMSSEDQQLQSQEIQRDMLKQLEECSPSRKRARSPSQRREGMNSSASCKQQLDDKETVEFDVGSGASTQPAEDSDTKKSCHELRAEVEREDRLQDSAGDGDFVAAGNRNGR